MESNENVSEKYRKYLLKVTYDNQYYYTISGADLEDEEKDKLLINSNKQLVLFSEVASLLQAIKKGEYYFDRDNLQRWEKEFSSSDEPYAQIDLDILGSSDIDLTDLDVLISIHYTIGILTDFSIQIDDKLMIARLHESVIGEFNDSVMDYTVWKAKEDITIAFDRNLFLGVLNDLYFLLKKGMILVVY
jgi:hypothetical protein